ncbi:hypothetical protein KY346_03925 [Candidatus Woesearchaeota archaeon]|nr:hypothetical protein [Candidatus Woesearchaeota archaeon]
MSEKTYKPFDTVRDLRGFGRSITLTAATAAVETDLYINKTPKDLENVYIMTELAGRNVIPGDELETINLSTDHVHLWQVLHAFSEKPKTGHISEYALDLKLLHMDLKNFESLPKEHLENLRDFFISLARHFGAREYSRYPHRRYVA